MTALSALLDRASANKQHIILPEGADIRIIEAASIAVTQGIAQVTIVGESAAISKAARNADIDIKGVTIAKADDESHFASVLYEARRHKGLSMQDAEQLIKDPLMRAAAMVRAGHADGMVAGATRPTADVVRSALQLIGMKAESKIVSSFFLMQHNLPHQAVQGTALYADCGLVIDPSSEELACIAIDSADSAVALAGIDPVVALLSFSTAGSAAHPNVDKVRDAGAIIAAQRPDIKLMAEVQFDAAILPSVRKNKAPEIKIDAPANVFIFPDLQSGNIGYKIAQRVGGAVAVGPILQGLNHPVNDLSRGCSAQDIVYLIAATAIQAVDNIPS